jgi:hypothetical protein
MFQSFLTSASARVSAVSEWVASIPWARAVMAALRSVKKLLGLARRLLMTRAHERPGCFGTKKRTAIPTAEMMLV